MISLNSMNTHWDFECSVLNNFLDCIPQPTTTNSNRWLLIYARIERNELDISIVSFWYFDSAVGWFVRHDQFLFTLRSLFT